MFNAWPFRNRREEERLVVEGLEAFVDGFPAEIIDLSASAARLVRPDLAPLIPTKVVLRLKSMTGAPSLDISIKAKVQRETYDYLVLRYDRPMPNWAERIKEYDTFRQVSSGPVEAA